MAKHLSGHAKKWLMITGIGILIVGGGYGGYVWYQRQQQPRATVSDEDRKQAAGYRFAGDQDVAAQYVSFMRAGKVADAQQLFASRADSEPDTQKKADLYVQNINLALSLSNTDAALEAGERLVEVDPTHESYAQLAAVYVAREDTRQQAAYLQKAIDALKSASDVPDKDSLMAHYQSQLDAANEWLALKERNDW